MLFTLIWFQQWNYMRFDSKKITPTFQNKSFETVTCSVCDLIKKNNFSRFSKDSFRIFSFKNLNTMSSWLFVFVQQRMPRVPKYFVFILLRSTIFHQWVIVYFIECLKDLPLFHFEPNERLNRAENRMISNSHTRAFVTYAYTRRYVIVGNYYHVFTQVFIHVCKWCIRVVRMYRVSLIRQMQCNFCSFFFFQLTVRSNRCF